MVRSRLAIESQSWSSYGRDFLASLVVFLVALPLSMGIALASGLPPMAGIVSGIIGGILVGAIGGSPLQVTGPAAGLIVLVSELVSQYERPDGSIDVERGMLALGIAIAIGGGLQIVAGLFRLGQWFRAVSPAVIQGMLAGIGVLIVATQFHVMLDDEPKRDGALANLYSIPAAIEKGVFPLDGSSHHKAASIGLLTIVVIVLWKRLVPARLKFLPGPLAGVAAAILVADGLNWDIKYVQFDRGLFDAMPSWNLETAGSLINRSLIVSGISIAVVASAETLLCATAVDRMHQGPRTRYDRELFAQGVGNVLCGMAGGLPLTGVIVRSSANVDAGAQTRLSTMLHGCWLLVLVVLYPRVLELIPRCSLAAILVYSGYKLVNLRAVRDLLRHGRGELLIYVVTVGVIVVEDLLIGVLVGIALSAARLLIQFARLSIHCEWDVAHSEALLTLKGAATFVRLPKLAAALEQFEPDAHVRIDVSRLRFVDHACLDLLTNWTKQHEAAGGRVDIDWGWVMAKFEQVETSHKGSERRRRKPIKLA